MELTNAQIAELVKKVLSNMGETAVASAPSGDEVPVGVSNRHIHLNKADMETLFGAGYELTPMKDLSQPGQYACKETLTLIGPAMRPIENVRVLGSTKIWMPCPFTSPDCIPYASPEPPIIFTPWILRMRSLAVFLRSGSPICAK